MIKKITLCLALALAASFVSAQGVSILNLSKQHDKELNFKKRITHKQGRSTNQSMALTSEDLKETLLLEEDFSKFTAGSETAPDKKPLDNELGIIDDMYFHTPGWGGFEVYQAGGMAYLGYSHEEYYTGMLVTPALNLSGGVVIRLKARSTNPRGDWFNYNVFDNETFEVVDANYYYIGDTWTDVEFISTYGTADAQLFLFTEQSEVYVDDIQISRLTIGTPNLLPESNVTAEGFSIEWDNVPGANEYDVFAFADHKVGDDCLCVWADFNFDEMQQGGTENAPVVDFLHESISLDKICPNDYAGWMVYTPAYADGMVGVSGLYADYGMNGSFASSEMDLSGDGGKITISFDAKAPKDDVFAVAILSLTDEGYDYVDFKYIGTTGEWEHYEVTLTGGSSSSSVQIIYGGTDIMLIDNVRLTQKLEPGTLVKHQFLALTTFNPTADITIPTRYIGDKISYAVRAVRTLTEDLEGEEYVTGALMSDFTELRYVDLPTTGIIQTQTQTVATAAYDLHGRAVEPQKLMKGQMFIQNGKVRIK